MVKEILPNMRRDYGLRSLYKRHLNENPLVQFEEWFKEATVSDGNEANVCTLSTLDENQIPDGRIVLLKYYGEEGFIFYTNYESDKAQHIEKHPFAAMTFHWRSQERQVRLKGRVTKIDTSISDTYFHERPHGSRIGAWASPQSRVIPNRAFLDNEVAKFTARFATSNQIPRPAYWGGYVVSPKLIEFWQGRASRLHDRMVYVLENDRWITKRLAP